MHSRVDVERFILSTYCRTSACLQWEERRGELPGNSPTGMTSDVHVLHVALCTRMLRVKRGLKKARLFEIQKLTRRLKMLEKKRYAILLNISKLYRLDQ